MDIFSHSFALQTQNILLAEDDPDDVAIFREVISDFQITIHLQTAPDGQQALDVLSQSEHIDIVFMDINMLRMNGLECLSELRQQSWDMPVVMLSTSNDDVNITAARKLGANGFITKPSSMDIYRQTIKEVLTMDWNKGDTPFYLAV